MEFTANQIADIVGGTIEGDENIKVSSLSKIEEGMPGSLSFLSNPKYIPYIYETKSSITLVSNAFKPERPYTTTLLRVEDPYSAFTSLLEYYNNLKNNKIGISKQSIINDSVTYGENFYLGYFSSIGENSNIGNEVKINPNVFIGSNVKIGNNVLIYSGSHILDDTVIGNNCIIHSHVIIGGDGFGFSPQKDGSYVKIPQTGNVIIEDNVEIGAGSTIDRATLGSTLICKGVKLDNQIQIAHNVEVGENTVIAAQSGVAGSSKIGKNCRIGGQVGISGHIVIGDNVSIQGQTGVTRNLKNGKVVMGSPAIEYKNYQKSYIHFKNLDHHIKSLESLKSTTPNNE